MSNNDAQISIVMGARIIPIRKYQKKVYFLFNNNELKYFMNQIASMADYK